MLIFLSVLYLHFFYWFFLSFYWTPTSERWWECNAANGQKMLNELRALFLSRDEQIDPTTWILVERWGKDVRSHGSNVSLGLLVRIHSVLAKSRERHWLLVCNDVHMCRTYRRWAYYKRLWCRPCSQPHCGFFSLFVVVVPSLWGGADSRLMDELIDDYLRVGLCLLPTAL